MNNYIEAKYKKVNHESKLISTEDNFIAHIKGADIVRNDEIILKDINLKICQGEFVFILGKTGSGKTSLLKSFYGEVPLKKGICNVAGFNLLTIKWKELPSLRRHLGIIFQDFQLLNDRTVYENLEFVLNVTGWKNKNQMDDRIISVLKKVGLDAKIDKMPYQLSAGEQNILDIARAILNYPAMIIADEPTGNLDGNSKDKIMNLLLGISKENKTAVLIATHDMEIVEKFPGKKYETLDHKLKDLN